MCLTLRRINNARNDFSTNVNNCFNRSMSGYDTMIHVDWNSYWLGWVVGGAMWELMVHSAIREVFKRWKR